MIQWCSGCRDGGTVVLCNTCQIISMCTICVDFGMIDTKFINFTCPPCSVRADKNAPYVGCDHQIIWLNDIQANSRTSIFVQFPLPGRHGRKFLPPLWPSSPSIWRGWAMYLLAWHITTCTLGFMEMLFMSSLISTSTLHTMILQLVWTLCLLHSKLVVIFKSILFFVLFFVILIFSPFRWKQFFVFITTHSDPRNGYLHIAPNNAGAVPASEVQSLLIHLF